MAVWVVGAWLWAARPSAEPQTEDPLTDDTVAVRTEGAHQLLLPKDWPVKYVDGRYAPAPVEEYLSLKFSQVRAKFDQMAEQMGAVERRLSRLEEDQQALVRGLRALEERTRQPQEDDDGGQTQGR